MQYRGRVLVDHADHRGDQRANAQTHLDWAAIAILFAIPFDALDGRIARMTNTCSDFGKELDSLADVITFGVAPSLLALVWGFHFLPETMHIRSCGSTCCRPAPSSASCFCSAERRGWRGSTSPTIRSRAIRDGRAASILWACRFRRRRDCWRRRSISATAFRWRTGGLRFLALLVGLAGFLMVSTWRFWSGKEINFSRRHPFQLLVLMAIVMYVMIRFSKVVMFGIGAGVYVFGDLGAGGVWMVAAAAKTGRDARSPAG